MSGAAYFSTGRQLRHEMEGGTDLGRRAAEFLAAGQYVPDAMAEEIAFNWLGGVTDGWILDGFPRTVPQARELDRFLGSDRGLLQAVLLDVPVAELERRVSRRRECHGCTWVGTPEQAGSAGACPECGGTLRIRSDDALENFRKRMAAYDELTKPVADHYVECGRLRTVSGTGPAEEVFERLQSSLEHP